MRDAGMETSTASIERQIGELVGTVRMTVDAVDGLRATVERMAEVKAPQADLDRTRAELRAELAAQEVTLLGELGAIRSALDGQIAGNKKAIAELQRWAWIGWGVLMALGAVGKFVEFPARIVLGGQ